MRSRCAQTHAQSKRDTVVEKPKVADILRDNSISGRPILGREYRGSLRREEVDEPEPKQLRAVHDREDGHLGVLEGLHKARPCPVGCRD